LTLSHSKKTSRKKKSPESDSEEKITDKISRKKKPEENDPLIKEKKNSEKEKIRRER